VVWIILSSRRGGDRRSYEKKRRRDGNSMTKEHVSSGSTFFSLNAAELAERANPIL
jgi:hypothetical protein